MTWFSHVAVYNRPKSRNVTKSTASEPIRSKRPAISLTEEALAIHNNEIPPQQTIYPPTAMEDDNDTELIMERVDEKCRNIQLEFDEKIKASVCILVADKEAFGYS